MSRVALLNVTMPTLSIGKLLKVLRNSKSHTDIYSTFGSSTDAFLMPMKKFLDDVSTSQTFAKEVAKTFFDTTELFESVHTTRAVIPKDSIGISNDPIAFGAFKRESSNLSLRSQLHFSYGITLDEQTASVLAGIDSLFSTKGLFDTTGINEDIWAGQAKIRRSRAGINHLTKKYSTLTFITNEPEYIEAVPAVTGGAYAYLIAGRPSSNTLIFTNSIDSVQIGDGLQRIEYSQGQSGIIEEESDWPLVTSVDVEAQTVVFDRPIFAISFAGNGLVAAVLIRAAQLAIPGYYAGSLGRLSEQGSLASFVKKYTTTGRVSSASMASKVYANNAVYNKDTIEHSEFIKKFVSKAPLFSSTEAFELVKKHILKRPVSSGSTTTKALAAPAVYNKDTIEHIEFIKKFVGKALASSTEASEIVKKHINLKKFLLLKTSSTSHENISVYNKEIIEHSELIKKSVIKAPLFSSTEAFELVKKHILKRPVSSGSTTTKALAAPAVYNKDTIEHIEFIKKFVGKALASSTEASEIVKKHINLKKFLLLKTSSTSHENISVYNKEIIEHSELIKKSVIKAPRFSSTEASGRVKKMPMLGKFSTSLARADILAAGALKLNEEVTYARHLLKKHVEMGLVIDDQPLQLRHLRLTHPLEQTYTTPGVNGTPRYNKAYLSSVEGIRGIYSVGAAGGRFPNRVGDIIEFYNDSSSATATYTGFITSVGSNWVTFKTSPSTQYYSFSSSQDNRIQFDGYTNIKVIRNAITQYTGLDALGDLVLKQRPRTSGVNRGTTRVGTMSGRNVVNWRGIGIALGARLPLTNSYNTRTFLHGVNYSTLEKNVLGLDNGYIIKKFYKKNFDAANIQHLIKKYVTKNPFSIGFDTASISHENYARYNKLLSTTDASLVKKDIVKNITDIAVYALYSRYNRDSEGEIQYLTDISGNPTSTPSVIGIFGVDEIFKKYVTKGKRFSSARIATYSYQNRSRLNKSAATVTVDSSNTTMKRIGPKYELVTYYNNIGTPYDILTYKDPEQLDVTTQFDRIADYKRDFTTDSVSVDTTVSIFTQDYANAYFAEDYVGNAITS